MKLIAKIMLLFLICSSAISKQINSNDCPKADDGSYLTKNNNGHSTYKGNGVDDSIKNLIQKYRVNLSKPILDVGAGYGSVSYEFTKLGAKNLYINELNAHNLQCLKMNLERSFAMKEHPPHYLLGDITDPNIFNTIPENSLGLIYAQNVIHFFTAQQVINFFMGSARALENEGILFLSFENRFLVQQKALMDTINNEYDSIAKEYEVNMEGASMKLDSIVIERYKNTPITPNGNNCSAQDYERTPKRIRMPGFPCLLESEKNGQLYHYQLLTPEIVAVILENAGFKVLGVNQSGDKNGAMIVLARKVQTK